LVDLRLPSVEDAGLARSDS